MRNARVPNSRRGDLAAGAHAYGRDALGVIGVIGGSGGVGASSFAAVLAWAAGRTAGRGILIDADASSGGLDVLLGIEHEPGARWSGLRVDGGHLDPGVLVDGLPSVGSCSVLAADASDVDAAALGQVATAAAAAGPVVIDLPRWSCPERDDVLPLCRLVVLVARGDVSGLVSARKVVASVQAAAAVPVGLVVRQGEVPADDSAVLVGAPMVGVLPAVTVPWRSLDLSRPPSSLATVARGVLAGMPRRALPMVA